VWGQNLIESGIPTESAADVSADALQVKPGTLLDSPTLLCSMESTDDNMKHLRRSTVDGGRREHFSGSNRLAGVICLMMYAKALPWS
jgi:hypothetical protein